MMLSWKFEEFKRKFEEAMAYTNQTNLDKFDLVFFPIVQAGSKANHFYLIVYNLKTLEVDIIDNKKEESQDIVRRYGELPKKLTTSFGVYLQSVGHPNGIKMTKAKPKIMNMNWQTTTNYLDAGVFVMRHMECFNGRKIRFNAGLQVEGKQQIRQLNDLRIKYLVKMLMIEINEKVGQVDKEAKEYNGYNENQKR
ncbi:ulp1 protease family, C-terminal catalytic domain-containing protein, partial [Tanacetum coccineum]